MTLDAGKSLRSVITENQRYELMFVKDYKYPTHSLLHVTTENLMCFLLLLFNEIGGKKKPNGM